VFHEWLHCTLLPCPNEQTIRTLIDFARDRIAASDYVRMAATDLNQPMLNHATTRQSLMAGSGEGRPMPCAVVRESKLRCGGLPVRRGYHDVEKNRTEMNAAEFTSISSRCYG
jgi:hypothetical protein